MTDSIMDADEIYRNPDVLIVNVLQERRTASLFAVGNDSDAGRDWGQEEKGTIEDEMAGWHHRLDGHEFE